MPFAVYDYRTDVRNVVILPDIRSRFLRMEPGEVGARHSHDLGQEVFLILEGECEFEIEGETVDLSFCMEGRATVRVTSMTGIPTPQGG